MQYSTSLWQNILQPYSHSYDIIRCPSAPVALGLAADVTNGYGVVYGLTGGVVGVYSQAGYPSRHIASIVEPARTFAIVESRFPKDSSPDYYATRGYGNSAPDFGYPAITRPEDDTHFCDTRHFDGSIIGFVDGHAKWIKSGQGTQYILKLPDVRS